MRALLSKSLVFGAILVFILLKIEPYFVDNSSWDVSSFNSFYEEDKNSSDIVFIGSSHLNKGIDTYILDANCNTNSIKISGAGMNIAQTYFNLKEVLTRQSPKIVSIETFGLIVPNNKYNNSIDENGNMVLKSYNTEYYKRFGMAKLEEISSIYPEDKVFHMFNFFRFHDVWTDVETLSKSIDAKLSFNPKKINQDINKYTSYFSDVQMKAYQNKEFDTKGFFISDDEKLFLEKIIQLSKEHNFELLFFTVPVLDVYYKKTAIGFKRVENELREIFKSHKNITYYDINSEVGGYDKTRFLPGNVNNNQHLNYKGIINTTHLLSKFIKKNYKFDSHLKKPVRSIEDILYSHRKIEKDTSFLSYISTVNGVKFNVDGKVKTTIAIPKNQKYITIKGWMFKDELPSRETTRKIALKKNNSFIFISKGDLSKRSVKNIANKYGEDYLESGYQFKIDKNALEKGKYKIYNIIESDKGDILVKDMWKWITIE
ncbi:hypothetical protein [Winogradskyella psychrotolerans]|uniref:hypothetical protein n=1 Tax=Winogradskyella psychrotolerans TaxID=1344585 RepID=UPI001C079D03|nr:hypothetical protein [Winogradskyella psychrotolerans]MBU2926781.1 hypothetical protein [Winogradskyella psychrotolerans]